MADGFYDENGRYVPFKRNSTNPGKVGETVWGTHPGDNANQYGREIGYGAPSYLRIDSNGKVTDTRYANGNNYAPTGGTTYGASDSGSGGYGGMDWAKYLEDYMSQARSAINNAYKENIRQSGMTYEGSDKPTLARRAEAQERWLNQNTSPNSGAYMSGRLDIANTLNSGLANARRDRATRDANYRIQRDQELANINSNAMNLMLPYLMSKMM